MLLIEKREWADPISIMEKIPRDHECWAFLYSSMKLDYSGNLSILAVRPEQVVKTKDFEQFSKRLCSNKEWHENSWFGYLGYGLRNSLEKLPKSSESVIKMPSLWMTKYKTILVFKHIEKIVEVWSKDDFNFDNFFSKEFTCKPHIIGKLASNMSQKQYLKKVAAIKEMIASGDLYQANLTRKFYGKFKKAPNPVNIFTELCRLSPSPYSCIMRLKDTYVISSSPELFLKCDNKGNVESRPIKGSAPRHKDREADRKEKNKLLNSSKDKAENLMIVDLMRNDLSRSCVMGTVKVKSLFDITSYATIHQMSSTIVGRKANDVSTISMVKNCFPPGSMTGTPKIKAMEVCSGLENQERGIYSGAIGWFGGDGSTELSVVIRTLLIRKRDFEFQVGGAIVSDSKAKVEFDETINKARAIIKVLGISKSSLVNL